MVGRKITRSSFALPGPDGSRFIGITFLGAYLTWAAIHANNIYAMQAALPQAWLTGLYEVNQVF
jgi:hypothetical protein